MYLPCSCSRAVIRVTYWGKAQSVVIVYPAQSWSGKSLSTVLAFSTISSIFRRCIYIAKDLLKATNGYYIQTLYGTKCISHNVTNYLLCAPGAARTTHTGRRVRSSSPPIIEYQPPVFWRSWTMQSGDPRVTIFSRCCGSGTHADDRQLLVRESEVFRSIRWG